MQHLIQLNTIYALPYVGSALARLLNRRLREDQIVKLANILEMHPDMVQSFLHNTSLNEVQQQKEDFISVSSLSSFLFSSSPSLSFFIISFSTSVSISFSAASPSGADAYFSDIRINTSARNKLSYKTISSRWHEYRHQNEYPVNASVRFKQCT